MFALSPIYKYLIGAGLVISVLIGAYLKGRHDCSVSEANKTYADTIHKIEETRKVTESGTQFKAKIHNHRLSHPTDDARDSCLLSSSNPTKDCDKLLQPSVP